MLKKESVKSISNTCVERSLRKRKLSTVAVESPKKRCKSANNKRTKVSYELDILILCQ
jgi:hypothetical protein